MRPLLALCLLALSTTASAFPREFAHQGRLMDQLGAPLTGDQDVTMKLFDAPSGGAELWAETTNTSFDNGYFSLTLGGTTGLELDDIDQDEVWVEITIGTTTPIPTRQRLNAVPYAVMSEEAGHAGTADHATSADSATTATTATAVSGGVVNATEIQINGTTVIDSSGALSSPTTWSTLSGIPSGFADDTDDDTQYTAGTGLDLTNTEFSVNNAELTPDWDNVTSIPADIADGDDVLSDSDVTTILETADTYVRNDGDAVTGGLVVDVLQTGSHAKSWSGRLQGRGSGAQDDLWYIGEILPPSYDNAGLIIETCHASRWNSPTCQETVVTYGRYAGSSTSAAGDTFHVETRHVSGAAAEVPFKVSYGQGAVGARPLLVWAYVGNAAPNLRYYNVSVSVRGIGAPGSFTPGDFSRDQIANVTLEN